MRDTETFTGDTTPLVHLFRDELPEEGARGDAAGWTTAQTAAHVIRHLTMELRTAHASCRNAMAEASRAHRSSAESSRLLREEQEAHAITRGLLSQAKAAAIPQPEAMKPIPDGLVAKRAVTVRVHGYESAIVVNESATLGYLLHLALKQHAKGDPWGTVPIHEVELRDADGVRLNPAARVSEAPLREPLHVTLRADVVEVARV